MSESHEFLWLTANTCVTKSDQCISFLWQYMHINMQEMSTRTQELCLQNLFLKEIKSRVYGDNSTIIDRRIAKYNECFLDVKKDNLLNMEQTPVVSKWCAKFVGIFSRPHPGRSNQRCWIQYYIKARTRDQGKWEMQVSPGKSARY